MTPDMHVQALSELATKKWGSLEGFLRESNRRRQASLRRKNDKKRREKQKDQAVRRVAREAYA